MILFMILNDDDTTGSVKSCLVFVTFYTEARAHGQPYNTSPRMACPRTPQENVSVALYLKISSYYFVTLLSKIAALAHFDSAFKIRLKACH